MRRALAVYISQRDMAQLFIKSIDTPDIRDGLGVPFQIFYGISANPHAIWSIANARRVIGYAPEDNSEERFFRVNSSAHGSRRRQLTRARSDCGVGAAYNAAHAQTIAGDQIGRPYVPLR